MNTVKIPKTLLNIGTNKLGVRAKAILFYIISNADQAGIYHINRNEFKKHLGSRLSKRLIETKLSEYVVWLDSERLLVKDYLVWNYGDKLKQIENMKYNPLTKVREAINLNGLSYDHKLKRLSVSSNKMTPITTPNEKEPC